MYYYDLQVKQLSQISVGECRTQFSKNKLLVLKSSTVSTVMRG